MASNDSQKRRSHATVGVEILGQRMVLRAEGGDKRRIVQLADYVRRRIDDIAAHGRVSESKLAVLAALNIADDYFRANEVAEGLRRRWLSRSPETETPVHASATEEACR